MSGFAGRVALVTGSSRGIGRAIALRLARQLAPRNVTVNAVAPGLVPETGMTADLEEGAMAQMLVQVVPPGRPGTPEEAAHAVALLAGRLGALDSATYLCDGSR